MKSKIILSLLILSTTLTFGQNIDLKTVTKGLEKISTKDLARAQNTQNVEIGDDTKIYNSKGEEIFIQQLLELLKAGDTAIDYYVNDNKELQLIIARKKLPSDEQVVFQKSEGMAPQNNMSLEEGDTFLDFKLTDLKGNSYNLNDLKGKVLVLNFWFISCPPCIEEMPSLNKLIDDFKDNEDVIFLAITFDEIERTEKFLKKKDFKYNIIANERKLQSDLGLRTYPKNIVVGKDSKVAKIVAGYADEIYLMLKTQIDESLKK